MANICSNVMAVYGPREDLDKFLKCVKDAVTEMGKPGNGRGFEKEFFLRCGYAEDELKKLYGFGPMDLWGDPQFFNARRGRPAHVKLWFGTCWSPVYESWDALLKRSFPTLKEVTLAEESGCDVYVNTDSEGLFFDERFYVCGEYDGKSFLDRDEHIFPDEKSALAAINDWTGMRFESLDEVRKWFDENPDHGRVSINEYSEA